MLNILLVIMSADLAQLCVQLHNQHVWFLVSGAINITIWGEGDWKQKYLEIPSVFRPGFNRGLFPTWKLKLLENCFTVCKKVHERSAAKHQLHQIFEAIWDTAHYLVKQP